MRRHAGEMARAVEAEIHATAGLWSTHLLQTELLVAVVVKLREDGLVL